MTKREEIVAKIDQLNSEIAVAIAKSEAQSKAYNDVSDKNNARVVEFVQRHFPEYRVQGSYRSALGGGQSFRFNFRFDEGNSSRFIPEFCIEYSGKGFIKEIFASSMSVRNHDVSTDEEVSKLFKEIAEFQVYYTMVGKVTNWFNLLATERNVLMNLINNKEIFEWTNEGMDSASLKREVEELTAELRFIDMNLTPGSLVEYNESWERYGRVHDNWKTVKILKVTAARVTMAELYTDKATGELREISPFQKAKILDNFRSIAEGDAARKAEEEAVKAREARWAKTA